MHLPSLPIIINHILSPWTAHVKLFYLISEIPDSLLVFQKHRPKKQNCMGPENVAHTELQTSILGFDLHFGSESE